MNYLEFLTKVLNDGIEAAKKDYADRPDRLRGSLSGFEACRGKSPVDLAKLLAWARGQTHAAMLKQAENYWEVRCFEAEVEWTCNCVSALMVNSGMEPIVPPTARGTIKAAEIAGVAPVGGALN